MGDAQCRPAYREQVKQFILDRADEMCDEVPRARRAQPAARLRLQERPLPRDHGRRAADGRQPVRRVPRTLRASQALSGCRRYRVCRGSHLVRGLDYYTRTVFEVEAPAPASAPSAAAAATTAWSSSRAASPRPASASPSVLSAPCWPCRRFGSDLGAEEARASMSPTPAGAAPERLCHYAGASRRRHRDRGRLSGPFAQGPV